MTINLESKIQDLAFNRELSGNVFTLEFTYEQNIQDEVFTSVLTPVYIGARWSIMSVDLTALDLHDGQAHYKVIIDGEEVLNGRMNINLEL